MTVTSAAPAVSTSRQRLVLFVLLGAGFLMSVDFSILDVALPEAGAGVGMAESQLHRIAAYALLSAGFASMRKGSLCESTRLPSR